MKYLLLCTCALTLSPLANADLVPAADFTTADDLEVTVWATTPQLRNPTNMDIDGAGRVWVTEAVNYRIWNNGNFELAQQEGDRVVVLTDSNGDGRADKSHTFAQEPDLVAPLGIAVIDNRVVVSCSPHLIVYTDVDRNLVFDPAIDKREILLSGFGGHDHDHSLHSVTVGPDGWWYFNAGNDGPHTVTDKSGWTLRAGSSYGGWSPKDEKDIPGRKSDDGRVWVGGLALRMRPDGTDMRPIGHNFRNSYEQFVSSWGDVFQNDNDDPPACRTTWLMEGGNLGFSSADGQRSWQADRRPGQSVAVAQWRQQDPGVIPAGDVYGGGAPCGIVFVENSAIADRYPRGLLLSCESARSVVYGYVPRPDGAGFELERFNFLKSTGERAKWFRPSDVAVGPDGAIYVADWYDPGVGGHRMADKTASGTIYRIAPRGFTPRVVEFDPTTPKGAVVALKSASVNVRSIGFEALRAQGPAALPQLERLLTDPRGLFAARAVWVLPHCGPAGIARCEQLLAADDARMRTTALRALIRAGQPVAKYAELLSEDSSPAVRRELLLALRDVPWSDCRDIVIRLAEQFDGRDRWYLEAIGTACEGKEAAAYEAIVGDVSGVTWDDRLAAIAWRLHPPEAVRELAARAECPDVPHDDRRAMMTAIAFIPTRDAAEEMLALALRGPEDGRDMAAWWGHNRGQSSWREYGLTGQFPDPPRQRRGDNRQQIIKYRPPGKPLFVSPVLREAKGIDINVDITGANRLYLVVDDAGDGFGNDWADWGQPLLTGNTDGVRLTSLNWMSAYTEWGQVTIDGNTEGGPLRPGGRKLNQGIGTHANSVIAYDISNSQAERFRAYIAPDDEKQGQQRSVRFSVHVDRSPLVSEGGDISSIVDLDGDPARGEHLFFGSTHQCARCHRIGERGGEIGPDLTSIAAKHDRRVMIESIIDPNAAISLGFGTVTVIDIDGRVTSGLSIASGETVVVKDAEGRTHRYDEDDIDEIITSKKSLMPDANKILTTQEVADLVAFLQRIATEQHAE